MLQAHSYLWHYLWIAPNLLLLLLAVLMWRRRLHKQFPVFLVFAIVAASVQLTLYVADIVPSVGWETWWRFFWAGSLVEALVKFVLIGEIFGCVFGQYPSVSRLGKRVISAVGVVLVMIATIAAAYTPIDNPHHAVISRAHILDQTIYMVECGVLLSIFLFASHFRLRWGHRTFGIALGLGISACVHLADWAVTSSGALFNRRDLLDFLNMATYHVCVLIWFYYLLGPDKAPRPPVGRLPEHNLEVLNHELERLIHQ
ncbi:MAG: hypothetical protein WA254_07245 [Candidatus Sulfotelmatobacter sp.]